MARYGRGSGAGNVLELEGPATGAGGGTRVAAGGFGFGLAAAGVGEEGAASSCARDFVREQDSVMVGEDGEEGGFESEDDDVSGDSARERIENMSNEAKGPVFGIGVATRGSRV